MQNQYFQIESLMRVTIVIGNYQELRVTTSEPPSKELLAAVNAKNSTDNSFTCKLVRDFYENSLHYHEIITNVDAMMGSRLYLK